MEAPVGLSLISIQPTWGWGDSSSASTLFATELALVTHPEVEASVKAL
jgi:hypothetical protein